MTRFVIKLLVLVCALFLARTAAAIEAEECVKLHASGQDDRENGKLSSARSSFLQCAAEECPNVVREECARLLGLVDGSLPTLVFEAKDESGKPTKDVRVSVDGKLLTEKLRATAIGVDPGEHRFTFEGPGGKRVTQELTVLEGQKNRLVQIAFADSPKKPPPPASEPSQERSVSPAAYVLGGVAVVSLGAFGYFALSGRSKQSDLEDTCAPNCASSEYDDMKRKYLFADIALGLAVVSGGVATWLFLDTGGKSESRVGVRAMPGGARAAWETRF